MHIKNGIVTSKKNDKTITVTVHSSKKHPKYQKRYTVSKKLYAHDPENKMKVGDKVISGENVEIKAGMPVIVSQGILIGKVEEVYANMARVVLLTDSESIINVRDLETEAKGVVRGKFGLGLVLEMVSQDDALSAGDPIITSGLGGDFPKGLLVGKIQEPKSSLDQIFQGATVIAPVKYSNLDVVFVIKN